MAQRRRIKHTATFEERLAEEAVKFKEAAEKQPPGSTARELLLRRARQAETASHINNWLRSPGLRPPNALENLVSDQKKWSASQRPELAGGPQVQDYQTSLEKLRSDAAEAALIRDLATDMAKRKMFDRLAKHLDQLADDVERVMNASKVSQE
jgi:hypothetical protein